ncbi:MAG: sulfatase-like hydrolase/transferase [Opitutaceae bacterium]
MNSKSRRPNVLILYTDQQRWDALGANGNRAILTPHLDRLAAEGVSFVRHFVQNPVCMPSRVSFLSGQYPSALKITHMGVPVPEDTETAATLFGRAGYRCANLGKLHFLPHANRNHRDPHPKYDFDHLCISDEPGCYEDAYHAWVSRVAPDQLDLISPGLPPARAVFHEVMGIADPVVHPEVGQRFDFKGAQPARCSAGVTHSAFVAEQTMEFMRRSRDETFFCIAGFYSPHAPWIVPQEYLNLYDPETLPLPKYPQSVNDARPRTEGPECLYSDEQLRSACHGYYAMVSEVDAQVGRILDCLKELDLEEDTIVVFTSDHGEWLGDHLRFGKGAPGDDSIARVPLLFRYPGVVDRPGRSEGGLVEAVDVLPTLLELAGIPVPGHLQGSSLAPGLTRSAAVGKNSVLMEADGWKTLRTDRYRYRVCADGSESLWDLAKDPGEYEDLANRADCLEVLAEMRRALLEKIVAVERPLPRTWPY